MRARHGSALIVLSFLAAIGLLLAVNPRGALSRAAIYDAFAVRLPRNLAEAVTPLGGERVLPLPVQQMIALLRSHQVERYRASPRIYSDYRYEQRILEGAWPIRRVLEAPWYLALADEVLPAGCQAVDRREDVILARCP